MKLRKSTTKWLIVFAGGCLLLLIDGEADRLGVLGVLAGIAAIVSAFVLLLRALGAAARLVTRRLTLRLALSYFLIGVVPVPLLALLLVAAGYLLSFQFIGGRLRREVQAVAEETTEQTPGARVVEVGGGKVTSSSFDWLPEKTPVAWAAKPGGPKLVLAGDRIWLAAGEAPQGKGRLLFLPLQDPSVLQRVADRTGYAVQAEAGEESRKGGDYEIKMGGKPRKGDPDPDPAPDLTVRPSSRPKDPTGSFLDRETVLGFYMARPVAVHHPLPGDSDPIVVVLGHTSPRLLWEELFSNWAPGAPRIVLAVMAGIAGALLFVYLVALALAFGLVASITRNINRMSRASAAIARGDFSVRVNTKSRDQIGDLARSFDDMAGSIQRLLVDTARKERLEGEIALARTIQQKLLPPPEASVDGAHVLAHIQSVAEIGGDYYDYIPAPDGRTAIAVGDVSGHGLPTGLLVAMAKSALSTLIETGLTGSPLFARLNEMIHRSTDSRSYMTLSLLVYDSAARRGALTNAGQLAPYRVSAAGVESLSLPSFPLGVSARPEFPTQSWDFSPGDRVVFLTDGLVECLSPSGDPFGFERFEAILAREKGSDADGLRAAILRDIEAHTGGAPPEDDRTLVIVTLD